MAGISLISNITQQNGGDFYLVDEKDVLGGIHQALTVAEMNAISSTRLKEGTLCVVVQPTPMMYIYSEATASWSEFATSDSSSGSTGDLWTLLPDNKTVEFIVDPSTYTKTITVKDQIKMYKDYSVLPATETAKANEVAYCKGIYNDGAGGKNRGFYYFDADTTSWKELITIPNKVSTFINDAGYITSADIPTDISAFTNDAGYLTSSDIPTKLSDLTNDEGFITTTDIPSWAMQTTKPTYTATEVGAIPDTKATDIDDAIFKKHEHNNGSVLDKITQADLNNWNKAEATPIKSITLNGNTITPDSSQNVNINIKSTYYNKVETDALLDKKADKSSLHEHANKGALDTITNEGDGSLLLANDGNYKPIIHKGDTAPLDSNIFWADNTDTENLKLKVYSNGGWRAVAGSGNATGGVGGTLSKDLVSNTSLGGITIGQTFTKGTTIEDVLVNLLVKHYEPVVSLNLTPADEYFEYGTTLPSIKFTVNIAKRTNSITNLDYYVDSKKVFGINSEGVMELAEGGEFTYTYAGNITKTSTLRVIVKDGKATTEKSKKINFVTPYYYGAANTVSINSFDNLSKKLNAKSNMDFLVTADDKYVVIAYDASYGDLKSLLDGNGFENLDSFNKSTSTIYGTNYNIYISKNKVTCADFKYTIIF